jgi:sporulation protein YlmC with PRC-barrel domain
MNTETLKGIAVVSLDEGAKLGTVDRALFDPATLQLLAFQIKGNGQTFIIPWERVQTIGKDAIMVTSSQATQTAASGGAFGHAVDLHALKQLKVVDASGSLIGTLRDLDLDPTSGRALSLTTHKGGLLGFGGETTTIEAAAIRGIGTDLITVTEIHTATTAAAASTDDAVGAAGEARSEPNTATP